MDRGVGGFGDEGGGSRFLGVGGSLVGKDLRRSSFLRILVTSEIADEVGSRRSLYEEGVSSILLRIFVAYGIAHDEDSRSILLDRSTSRRSRYFLESDVR